MTLRMPGVAYLGPPDSNWSNGPIRPPRGQVTHIAEGSFQGTINWQRNPAADVSSFFVVSLLGEIVQMLDLDLIAWTQAGGNPAWVGVENEGWHTGQLTPAQVEANARIFAWLVSVWPSIPYAVATSPAGFGLGWHGMGGAAWGNHPDCPGPNNVPLLPRIVARAEQINGGAAPSPTPRRKGKRMHLVIQPTDDSGIALAWPSDLARGWAYANIIPPGASGDESFVPAVVDAYIAAGAIDARSWGIPSFEGYTALADIPGETVELGDVTVGLGNMSVGLSGSLSGSIRPAAG